MLRQGSIPEPFIRDRRVPEAPNGGAQAAGPRLAAWAAEHSAIEQASISLSAIPSHEVQMLKFRIRPDPDRLGALVAQLDRRTWKVWEAIDAAMIAEHLSAVSPVVAEESSAPVAQPAPPYRMPSTRMRVG